VDVISVGQRRLLYGYSDAESLDVALMLEGLDVMRILSSLLILSSISTTVFFGTAISVAASTATNPPVQLAAWKSDFTAVPNDRLADLPPVLTPVDGATPADAPQNVPVEAVPTPTAVASGLLVLGGLAGVRIVRRIRTA
jgi:hypothetical protein